MSTDQGMSLPKFSEWDVNNPALAEGFTVIFSKARGEKKSNTNGQNTPRSDNAMQQPGDPPAKRRWCCFG